jgi:hypothetical protein
MTSTFQAPIDVKVRRHGGDKKQPASIFGVRIGRQTADIAESPARIENVDHGPQSAVVDHDISFGASASMPNDIADQLAQDEFGAGGISRREGPSGQRGSELLSHIPCRHSVESIQLPTIEFLLECREIHAQHQDRDIVRRTPWNHETPELIRGLVPRLKVDFAAGLMKLRDTREYISLGFDQTVGIKDKCVAINPQHRVRDAKDPFAQADRKTMVRVQLAQLSATALEQGWWMARASIGDRVHDLIEDGDPTSNVNIGILEGQGLIRGVEDERRIGV